VLQARARQVAQQSPPRGGINLSADLSDALTELLPERMVLCADLEAPMDHKRRLRAFTADDRSGAYVHCGVREHVMAAMANGMAAHGGVRPQALTYLAFADYERPALRMAALMALPVVFVFSHDSIGIGKNGPTHQPVEALAALRAMPNLPVMRPADATESAECWALALAHRSGPVALVFARQALPSVRASGDDAENRSRRGAYVLANADGGARRVTLLATGSEVALAVEARRVLQAEGVATAVVSMPCWELFEAQDATYRDAVLGPGDAARVAIEAAVRFGWERWIGPHGAFVGMRGFGASGPADVLYDHFDITVDHIVAQARHCLERIPHHDRH